MTDEEESMTDEAIERVRALMRRATKGPWSAGPMSMYIFGGDGGMVADNVTDRDSKPGEILRGRGHGAYVSGKRRDGENEANVQLVALAVALLPALLEVVEKGDAYARKQLTPAGSTSEDGVCDECWEIVSGPGVTHGHQGCDLGALATALEGFTAATRGHLGEP